MNKILLLSLFLFLILIGIYNVNLQKMRNVSSVTAYEDLTVYKVIPKVRSLGRYREASTFDVHFKNKENTLIISGLRLTIPLKGDNTKYSIKTVKVGTSHCLKSISINNMVLQKINKPLINCQKVTLL